MIRHLGLIVPAVVLVWGCAVSQTSSSPSVTSASNVPSTSVDSGEPILGPPWALAQRDQCNENFSNQRNGPVWQLMNDVNPLNVPADNPVILGLRNDFAQDVAALSGFERPDVIPLAAWNQLQNAASRGAAAFAQPMTPQSFHDEYLLVITPLLDVVQRCQTVATWVDTNVPQ